MIIKSIYRNFMPFTDKFPLFTGNSYDLTSGQNMFAQRNGTQRMKIISKILRAAILVALLIPTPYSRAQQVETTDTVTAYTLDAVIEYAMNNNRDLQNMRLDVESAEKKVWETAATGLPQAEATFDYTHIFDDAIELPFPDPMTGQPSTIDFKPTSNFKVQANQLVFSGEYLVGLKTSKIFKSLSQKNLVKTKRETRESVTNAYIMILVLQENEAILKENLKTLDQNIYEMSEMHKEGFIEDTDVDQLKLSKSNIETTLVNVSRQVELAYKLLKINMGMPMETELELSQSLDAVMDEIVSESLNSMRFQVQNNIDYQLMETQEELKKMELRQQQVAFLPTITGFYSHTEKLKEPEFDMTPKDLIGINVSIPLLSSGQRLSKVQQAKIELKKMENNKEALLDGLSMEFQQARLDYNTAFSKYLNEKENMALTKKIYDKTMIKYKEGLASSLDLSQVQSQHLQAQTNYYNAVLELVQAKTMLDRLVSNNSENL